MELELELKVDCVKVKEKEYYRCHIPKPSSNRLDLQKDDVLVVNVNRVLRQGLLIYGEPTSEEG